MHHALGGGARWTAPRTLGFVRLVHRLPGKDRAGLQKWQVVLSVLASVMVTPDLMAASDAGQAVLACVRLTEGDGGFWSASAASSEAEQLQAWRV